ncbi:MAG: hypothetical protein PF505_15280 [Vallitaleaceae bacterium]|jgi:sulfite exporter TauE/SafE|nr:hypothetical protein [Vallitaleaceae bacterium]
MDNILSIISLVLLFVGILFFLRQLRVIMSKRKDLGAKIIEIYPNRKRMRTVIIVGIAFVLIVIVASIYYVLNDISYTFANVLLISLALLSGGSFLGRVTILYEKGILAHMRVIEYHNIKSYDFRDLKSKKSVLTIILSDDLKFATVISRTEQEPVTKILKRFV